MKVKLYILIKHLAIVLVMSGCALSVNPIITETESIFDSRVLGSWVKISGSDRAEISLGTGNNYEIEYTSDGRTGRFGARVGKLGGRTIIDLWPAPRKGELPEPYSDFLLAGHLQLVLDFKPNEVEVAALDPDVLLKDLQSKKLRLPYKVEDDVLILTGTTEEMRKGLGPYFNRSTAFGKPEKWQRALQTESGRKPPANMPCFEAAAWREADLLFRRDPHWVGGDVASSVDLGNDRTLWLFGDTWIDPTGKGSRKGATMISNSVAIQEGRNPRTANISFYWGRTAGGKPDAMFPDRNGESLWFGNGVRADDRLILFFGRILRGDGVMGFENAGWTAMMVSNPDDSPASWKVSQLKTPTNTMGVVVGFAAVQKLDGFVIAMGSQDPVKTHPLFAVRWPENEVRRGNLLNPEWWAGERLRWIPDSSRAQRFPLFNGGSSELSVHFDSASQQFISIQTSGFGAADLMLRTAPSITGPWSELRMLYRPAEYYRPNVMIYAGKAHPELTGADLVLTYATNTFNFSEQITDSLIYYPRFVKLTRCR